MSVARIGLGLAALGRPGYINLGHAADLPAGRDVVGMEAHAHAVLDAAFAAGVRHFDAARSYGEAEAFLGSWLRSRGVRPGEVAVSSKWGYAYTAGWRTDADRHEVKDHSPAALHRQWPESRERLGPWLTLYQIHSATAESGVLADPAVLAELVRLRAEAGIRVGVSVSGPRQADTLRAALAARSDGARVFDSVQATWNLLEPSAGDALAEAHAAGLLVIVKEGLANGRLTDRNTDPTFAAKRATLEAVAGRLGCTLDALALAAVLARPWAGIVLSGAATTAHLRSNLAAAVVPFGTAEAAELAGLAEPPEVYWRTRSGLAWN